MRQWKHGLCICAIQMVNGQDKTFKCLLMGYGNRCTAHRFVSRAATLLGFSHSTVSRVYPEWSTTQRTFSQLDTTVGHLESTSASILVERFRHLVESIPRRIEAFLRALGGAYKTGNHIFECIGPLILTLLAHFPLIISIYLSPVNFYIILTCVRQ